MRKKLMAAILFMAFGTMLAAIPAGAAVFPGERKNIQVSMGGLTVLVNGEKAAFRDADGQVVEPILYQGTTYVPIRGVSDYLRQAVDYVAETRTVLIGSTKEQREMQSLWEEILAQTGVTPVWFSTFPGVLAHDQCALAAGGDYYFITSPGLTPDGSNFFFSGNEIWVYHPATQKAEQVMAGVEVHTIDSVDAQGNIVFTKYQVFGAEQLIGHTARKFWRAENRVTTVEFVPDNPQAYTEADIARKLAETFEAAYLQSAARVSALWSGGQYISGTEKM
ncbi:MAG: copper amine oxidase N-terminal domain-containing protein [Oscillospiraceae bacterium]|nr:copper amine oxidase N-terminal domain-containing protein [Oscillospiraceae bacterium]